MILRIFMAGFQLKNKFEFLLLLYIAVRAAILAAELEGSKLQIP